MESKIEYQEGPTEVELNSPFGKLWVKALGWGVYVDANQNGRQISINGVPYSFVLRLQYGANDRLELETGKSDPYGYHAIYMVKVNWAGRYSYNNSGGSNAAREKVKKVLIPLVQAWLDANPALVAEARFASASNDFRGADEDYKKAQAAVEAAKVALDEAWAKRADAKNELVQILQASAWRKVAS